MDTTAIIEKETKEAGAKAISREQYGTWFAEKATPQELITRCESQIADCKRWIVNLEALKVENKAKVKAALLDSYCTKEAIEAVIKDLQDKMSLLS